MSGLSTLSIDSESDGSIVQPAVRAALNSMKGTIGNINMKGTISGYAGFNSAGPLTKSVENYTNVIDILLPRRNFR
jgi:amidase